LNRPFTDSKRNFVAMLFSGFGFMSSTCGCIEEGKMKRQTIFLSIVLSIIFFAFTQQVSHAAHLELIDAKTEKTPEGPILQNGADACVKTLDGNADAGNYLAPDGHSAYSFGSGGVMVTYEDCAEAQGTFAGIGLALQQFVIEPGPGEKIGDCVQILYSGIYIGSATATGTAASGAAVGGFDFAYPFTIPSQIQVNGIPVFTYGPKVISAPPNDSFNDTPNGKIPAKIGDIISMEAGAKALVDGSTGTGSGTAQASARLEITIEPCPVPVPALSDLGVLIFASILVTTTWFFLRRRNAT
jgi:hypothetical protein